MSDTSSTLKEITKTQYHSIYHSLVSKWNHIMSALHKLRDTLLILATNIEVSCRGTYEHNHTCRNVMETRTLIQSSRTGVRWRKSSARWLRLSRSAKQWWHHFCKRVGCLIAGRRNGEVQGCNFVQSLGKLWVIYIRNIQKVAYCAHFRGCQEAYFSLVCTTKPNPTFSHNLILVSLSALAGQNSHLGEINERILRYFHFILISNRNTSVWFHNNRSRKRNNEVLYEGLRSKKITILQISICEKSDMIL